MKRNKTALKRALLEVLQFVLVLFIISFLTFSIMHLSPKNPAELWLMGTDGNVGMISDEAVRIQEKVMGLDKPFLVQYGNWLGKAIRGDLGISFSTNRPVTEELRIHVVPTLQLTFISLVLTILLAVPSGILSAVYKESLIDQVIRFFSFIGISVASFVMGLFLLWVFSIRMDLLPVIAEEGVKGLILPVAVLTIQSASRMTRQIRAIILDQLNEPYVEGALLRGVSYRKVLFGHVLRNSAVPILTQISIYTGVLLGGATIIESIFSINGLGRLAVRSITHMDYYMIQGFVLWSALVYLVINLITDRLSRLIDPRIRYGTE